MAFRGHSLGVVTTAALLLALAGCGDDTSPEPDLGPEPTEESSASEPTDATSTTAAAEPFDSEGSEFHEGRIASDDAAESAVADAWLEYWRVRGAAYHDARVDADALGRVAQGDAVQEVIAYVSQLQQDGTEIQGDTRVSVSEIEIAGSSAAVTSCIASKAGSDSGASDGKPSYATVVGTLEKVGGTWLVSMKSVTGEKRCR